MRQVEIYSEFITLGQLLKMAGVIGTGGEARDYLAEAQITVNGEPENRRGRKIRPGDVVVIEGGDPFNVVSSEL